jgi:hypothetical protein
MTTAFHNPIKQETWNTLLAFNDYSTTPNGNLKEQHWGLDHENMHPAWR